MAQYNYTYRLQKGQMLTYQELDDNFHAVDAAYDNLTQAVQPGTSNTTLTFGTGSKTLTTQTEKIFGTSAYVWISDTSNPSRYMYGQVTSYNNGSLTVEVSEFNGSGQNSDWTITVAGIQGPAGDSWQPVYELEQDGDRRVLRIVDWVGGNGPEPATGYIGPNGLTQDINNATNIRGEPGSINNYEQIPDATTTSRGLMPEVATTLQTRVGTSGVFPDAEDIRETTNDITAATTWNPGNLSLELVNSGTELEITPSRDATAYLLAVTGGTPDFYADFGSQTYVVGQFTTFNGLFTFSRNSTGYYLGADGLYHQAAVDEPRFAYNGDGSFRGEMKESQSTNILLDSNDMTTSNWGNNAAQTTAVPSIFGTGFSAYELETDGSFTAVSQYAGNLSSNMEVLSTIVEYVSSDQLALGIYDLTVTDWVILADVVFSSETITEYQAPLGSNTRVRLEKLSESGPNGGKVLRVSAQGVPSNAGNQRRLLVYPCSTTEIPGQSTIIHHVQHEVGVNTYTSPIVTQGSQVTRAEDFIVSDDASWYNNTTGTLFFEGSAIGFTGSYSGVIGMDSNRYRGLVLFGGGIGARDDSSNNILQPYTPLTPTKLAVVYGGGTFAVFQDGVKIGEKPYGGFDVGGTPINNVALGVNNLRQFTKTYWYSDKRLSDQEAIELTQ